MDFSSADAQFNTTGNGSGFVPVFTVAPSSVWILTDGVFNEALDTLRIADSDFGRLESRQTFFRQRVGCYIVAKPITILTYWNPSGYTSVIEDFDSVYGYGERLQEFVDDVLVHLEQDRDFFGQI